MRFCNVFTQSVPASLCAACCLLAAGFAAHQRGKALEALLWFSQLPSGSRGPAPLITPRQIVTWMSTGALHLAVAFCCALCLLRVVPHLDSTIMRVY
jgi:hypothetical protein